MGSIFNDFERMKKQKQETNKEEAKEIPRPSVNRFTNINDDISKGYQATKGFIKKNEPIIKQTYSSTKKVIGLASSRFGQMANSYKQNPILEADTPIWDRQMSKPKILRNNKHKIPKKKKRY